MSSIPTKWPRNYKEIMKIEKNYKGDTNALGNANTWLTNTLEH